MLIQIVALVLKFRDIRLGGVFHAALQRSVFSIGTAHAICIELAFGILPLAPLGLVTCQPASQRSRFVLLANVLSVLVKQLGRFALVLRRL